MISLGRVVGVEDLVGLLVVRSYFFWRSWGICDELGGRDCKRGIVLLQYIGHESDVYLTKS